jgi:alpha-mannosidase/mannosylglycerate hydrolase
VAVLLDALPEVQGVDDAGTRELAVTVLRSTGWLSRFDLRTRTTGAGPAFEVPEAQSHGHRRVRIGVLLGAGADDLDLAGVADRHHVPLRAEQVRGAPAERRSAPDAAPRVRGALVSALKPAESGDGAVLRLVNPTPDARTAEVDLPAWAGAVHEVRLDETPATDAGPRLATGDGAVAVALGPYGVRSLHLSTRPVG